MEVKLFNYKTKKQIKANKPNEYLIILPELTGFSFSKITFTPKAS